MYVAVTRARRRLYLSFSQSRMLHGQTRYNIPSRFLQEIPENLLKWLKPQQKGSGRSMESLNSPLDRSSGRIPNSLQSPGRTVTPDAASSRWRIGQNVTHPKFGTGVILNCEGRGADARVEVRFNRAGTKWLLLEYAKLTPT